MTRCGNKRRSLIPIGMLAVLVAGVAFVHRSAVSAEETEPKSTPKLSVTTAKVADLGWMEGTWRDYRKNGAIEQRWSAPLGESLVGTFRQMRNEEVWLYELMTISTEGGRIYFRLKHFTRKLASWEGQNDCLSFFLTNIESNKVVFRNPRYEDPRQVTFYRPVPETLIVRMEGVKDGEPTLQEFQFSRIGD